MNSNPKRFLPTGTCLTAAMALGALLPIESASAQSWGFSFAVRGAPVWVPPVYETRERVIIDPPVYEERATRVWRDPVFEDRRVRVEVPAEIVTRRVPVYNASGRIVGYRLVEEVRRPARSVWKTERVQVSPGGYETVIERVLVKPETRRVVREEVLVRPGRWESPSYWFHTGRPDHRDDHPRRGHRDRDYPDRR
jgi:hypothetical protein